MAFSVIKMACTEASSVWIVTGKETLVYDDYNYDVS